MERVSNKDCSRFLQAVGDPFRFVPDLAPQDGQPVVTDEHDPVNAPVALIELASSGLWREHLRRSNFTSCEEVVSTKGGKMSNSGYIPGASDFSATNLPALALPAPPPPLQLLPFQSYASISWTFRCTPRITIVWQSRSRHFDIVLIGEGQTLR